jgi:hypothetical protein
MFCVALLLGRREFRSLMSTLWTYSTASYKILKTFPSQYVKIKFVLSAALMV